MMWPIPDDDPNRWDRQKFPQRSTRDVRLAFQVIAELSGDARVSDQPIAVQVQNGVVVLTGEVDASETKEMIGDTVRRLDGVNDVCNTLRVSAADNRPVALQAEEQLFQDIVARLAIPESSPGVGFASDRRIRPFMVFLALALWVALTILTVWLAWPGVLIAVIVTTTIAGLLRRRTKRHASGQ